MDSYWVAAHYYPIACEPMSDMEHMELRPQRAMVEGPVALPRAEVAYRVEPEPGFIDFGGVWTAFRRNLWLILTISAVSVGIAALVVSRASTYYTATAIIRLINRNPGVTSGLSSDAPLGGGDPLASELMVLQGRNVIGRAVRCVDKRSRDLRRGSRSHSRARSTRYDPPPVRGDRNYLRF
jgi:uncharacterized protein involved in exopolysaccharide biosynthesis